MARLLVTSIITFFVSVYYFYKVKINMQKNEYGKIVLQIKLNRKFKCDSIK